MAINNSGLNVEELLNKWKNVGVTDIGSLKKYISDNPINIAVFTEEIDWSKRGEA